MWMSRKRRSQSCTFSTGWASGALVARANANVNGWFCRCENIRVVHLMANSREERTLIATMKLATPAATPGATASTGTADEATKK